LYGTTAQPPSAPIVLAAASQVSSRFMIGTLLRWRLEQGGNIRIIIVALYASSVFHA